MRFVIEIPDELFGAPGTGHASGNGAITPAALSGGAAPDSPATAEIRAAALPEALSAGPAEYGGVAAAVLPDNNGGAAPE